MKVKKSWVISGCVVALLGAYSLGGFLGVPYGLNSALKKYATPYLGRSVTAQKIRFNPYSLKLEVEGLEVHQSNSDKPFIYIRNLETDVSWRSLFKFSPVIEAFLIDGLHIGIVRTGFLTFNFSDIIDHIEKNLAESPKEDKKSSPLQFAIGNLQIKNSEINFEDNFRHRTDILSQINFDLPLISNFTDEIEHPITPRLSFNLNDAPVIINADSIPFSISRKTGISLSLSGIPLENLASFNPFELNAKFARGDLSTKLSLAFADGDDENKKDDGKRHLRLKGNVTLHNFGILNKLTNNAEVFAAKELSVDIEDFSYYIHEIKVGKVKLVEPTVLVTRNGETINLGNLATHFIVRNKAEETTDPVVPQNLPSTGSTPKIETATEQVTETMATANEKIALQEEAPSSSAVQDNETTAAPKEQPWSWSLAAFNILGGSVCFEDETAHYKGDIKDFNLALTDLSNKKDSLAKIQASLELFGTQAKLSGQIGLEPLSLILDPQIENFQLAQFQPYLAQYSNAELRNALFSCTGTLHYTLSQDNSSDLNLKGNLELNRVQIADKAGKDVLTFEGLKSEDFDFVQAQQTELSLGKIRLTSPSIHVSMLKDGSLNLLNLVTPEKKSQVEPTKTSSANSSESKAGKSSLAWNLTEAKIENGTVHFNDALVDFTQNISNLNAQIGSLTSTSTAATPLSLSCTVLDGRIKVDGSVLPTLSGVNLTVSSDKLSLPLLMPYLHAFTSAQLTSAAFSNTGILSVTSTEQGLLQIGYRGDAKISQLSLTDDKKQRIASWDQLSAGNLIFASDPLSVTLQSLTLANPRINLVKEKNGSLNISSLLVEKKDNTTKAQGTATATKTQTAGDLPLISVTHAQIVGGAVLFTDKGTKPALNLQLSKLNFQASNFTTAKQKDTSFQLKGNLNGAPIVVKGTAAPFATKVNLKLEGNATAISLPEFSPFSAEFTGYPIKQGQLNFQGNYAITNSQLESTNTMEISSLRFGSEIPDSKKTLPVGLAVSLLENRDGIIDLNIPVTGSLDDPDFSVGGIIVKAIVNLIGKAVTAPFSLIGSMFGGSPDMDLSRVQFASGSSKLTDLAQKELEVIGKAMHDRPGMKLQLIGISNSSEDDAGLRERLLTKRIQIETFGDRKTNKELTEAQINSAINRFFRLSDAPLPKAETIAEKKAFLLKAIPITDQDLQELATKRARRVYTYLVDTMKIAPSRLFIVAPDQQDLQDKAGVKFNIQMN